MKKIVASILCLTLLCILCACNDNTQKDSSIAGAEESTSTLESASSTAPEILSDKAKGQDLLDEFFVAIGTDISKSDIDNIAKKMGLYINHKNSGAGTYTYKVAADEKVASMNKPEKGSYVTVSFNTLKNDTITEITYFNMERMVAGYWTPDTGYLLADYNYPQIVYHDGDTDNVSSRLPANDAKEIVEYSFNGELEENLLETLFSSITSETTKDDLLAFVNEHELSYNSRGIANQQIIAYCYKIGDKFGENGSYITFSEDSNNLITCVTYWYYPANYKNGCSAGFHSESYATDHSVPSGFVLESSDGLTEYSSAEELLAQLHNLA